MKISKVVFLLLVVAVTNTVTAHNVKIATFNMHQVEGIWVLDMSFAQSSLDAALNQYLSDGEIATMSEDELKEWLMNYIRMNVSFQTDSGDILLGQGGIRLGSHQTDFKFLIPDLPKDINWVRVKMPINEFSYNHTNILRVFRGEEMTKFFLSSDNQFMVDLRIGGTVEQLETKESSYAWMPWLSLLIIPVIFSLGRKRE